MTELNKILEEGPRIIKGLCEGVGRGEIGDIDRKAIRELYAAYQYNHEVAKAYALKCGQLKSEVEYLKKENQRLKAQQNNQKLEG